jgi:hypothetical protein
MAFRAYAVVEMTAGALSSSDTRVGVRVAIVAPQRH